MFTLPPMLPIKMAKRDKVTGTPVALHFYQTFGTVIVSPYATCLISYNTVRRMGRGPWFVKGRVVMEDGYLATRYEFLGRWHNAIAFYDNHQCLTGYYCDIQRPLQWDDAEQTWWAEDLYLDLWVWPDGSYTILDQLELRAAERKGWITPELANKARRELADLIRIVETGDFPGILL